MNGFRERTAGHWVNRRIGVLALCTLIWLATIAAARLAPAMLPRGEEQAANWWGLALNITAGLIWIVAFTRYLRGLDELQRKVMIDALALTLGVAWVAAFAYAIAMSAGLVSDHVDLVAAPVLLAAVYLVSIGIGRLRYR